MRWLGPVVDREDDFTPFLTAHLPVRVAVLRRVTMTLALAGFVVALVTVLDHGEQVQLAGVTALEALVYLLLVDLPTRRLHRHSRVGVGYAALHLGATLSLIGWTWTLPLADSLDGGHGAAVLAALLGDPHPEHVTALRAVAWTLGVLSIAAGVALHLAVVRIGRRLAARPDQDAG